MTCRLRRRELVVFAAIVIFLETIYILGDSGPFWLVLGFVGPLAVLIGINLLLGLTRSRRREATPRDH
jgi:hypothetical protein